MVAAETFPVMKTWTVTAVALAHPAAVLDVLTAPDACEDGAPPTRRSRSTVRQGAGRASPAAWQRVGFDVEVRQADENGLQLSATGPVALDVDYRLAATQAGSGVHASVSVRPQRGFLSRLLAEATGALLSAGALDHALARLVREAA